MAHDNQRDPASEPDAYGPPESGPDPGPAVDLPAVDLPAVEEPPILPPTPAAGHDRRSRDWEKVRHTRTGRAWTGLIIGAIVLVLLLVFILQNLESTRVHLFFWELNTPVGIAVLFAVIIGALLAGLIGGARILQLRRAAKKP